LASACLPALHHAVILDGEAYWDGAYSGNPALFPLFYECDARDVMIVLLQPLTHLDLVIAASDIHNRTAELSAGMAFLREMRTIAQAKAQVANHRLRLGGWSEGYADSTST
jgi:NTE family protein